MHGERYGNGVDGADTNDSISLVTFPDFPGSLCYLSGELKAGLIGLISDEGLAFHQKSWFTEPFRASRLTYRPTRKS